jgi:hypothetical protein
VPMKRIFIDLGKGPQTASPQVACSPVAVHAPLPRGLAPVAVEKTKALIAFLLFLARSFL